MRRALTLVSAGLFVLASGAAIAACGSNSAVSTSTSTPAAALPARGPLSAPRVSATDEEQFFKDVTESDSVLATYVSDNGSIALKTLLTNGSAFCAFLARSRGIDDAMVALAIGAKSADKTAQLPSTVATFNAIEASALLTLCPSEQALLPAADRNKIRSLGESLARGQG
jgi:hypothetical protein